MVIKNLLHDNCLEYLGGLSDYIFDQLIAEILSMASQNKQMDIKEFASLTERVKRQNGVTTENSALNSYKADFLDEEETVFIGASGLLDTDGLADRSGEEAV